MDVDPKIFTQYCIDAQYALEVLCKIPKSIKIESLTFDVGMPMRRKKIVVPNALKKLGVTYMASSEPKIEVSGKVEECGRKEMATHIKEIANKFNYEPESVRVRSIKLSFNGTTAFFTSVTKAIHPDETDQRKKLRVLGLTSSEGNTAPMIQEINAKKYSCTFEIVPVRRVICK